MDAKECIMKRKSCRQYKSKSIDWDIVYDIIDAARYAPSPKNRQPWRFAVLYGTTKDYFIMQCRNSASVNMSYDNYLMNNEIPSEKETFDIADKAPVLILVYNAYPSEIALKKINNSFDNMNIQAIGAAIQNMLLRATELGLSCLCIGDITSVDVSVAQKYAPNCKLVSGIVLGYSAENENHIAEHLDVSELITFIGG